MFRIRRPRLTIGAIMLLIAATSVPIALEANRRREAARQQAMAEALALEINARQLAQAAEARVEALWLLQKQEQEQEHLQRQQEQLQRAERRRRGPDAGEGLAPQPWADEVHVRDLLLREPARIRPLATRDR